MGSVMMKLKTMTVIEGIEVSKAGEITDIDVYTCEGFKE